ncbi:uncharacterized protein [Mytilus edulis]|uniref:uncharacterized protein n=1 Tax=Mytilus edulis TaxID=6550 RepID=UPI0039EFFB7A
MEKCIVCLKDDHPTTLIKLRQKGCLGIIKASQERGDCLSALEGNFVHQLCRKTYTNPNDIKKYKKEKLVLREIHTNTPKLRSKSHFDFKHHCLFCGNEATDSKKKDKNVIQVRTDDFESRIQDACDLRNDDWAAEVRGRLESVSDLHAADAVYHQACSVNFRTCKNTPVFRSPISPDAKPENKRGRPALQEDGFYKTVDFLKHHDDEQISISDLVEKMDEMCDGNAYSQMYLKKRLKQHFGDEIIITDIPGRKSVVTLRETVTCILQDYYQRPSNLNPDDEKRALIRAAAKLIKSDIRSVDTTKSIYPTPANIASVDNNLSYLPESLLLFLSNIFSEIDPSVKIASIGQAVMQASRPRALITPLQLGLGVQVHHNFASRFLVSTLNSLGFCSSYYEVQKFESSAAAVQGVDLPGDISSSFVQFVADNVDHNTRTIDGLNTFHGMGIIAGITPGTKRTQPIPRIAFSTDEIKALAKIEIKYYKPQSDRMAELSYAELKNLNTLDKTFRLDLLSVIIWPLKYPIPMWSGFMQMVQTGDYPGKSSVSFLPMIDLNASDMTCIYSTLNFVANQAKRYDITAILTFDQPLYWKALSIVENENPGSTLKSMVLRLGPFHTEMSFLGSIGNLMSNTGLKEMLELIYAPNAVTHILSGKAVARAFRGHMLVDTALYCLLIADIFNIDVSKLLEEPNSTFETTDMKEIDELYSQLSSGELSASEAGESDVLKNLEATVHRKQEILKQSRTAKLWLQYSEMVQVLRQFIKAERTGNWPLHLQSIQEMLPFLAASGHNLYTKTAYVYLMTMQSLDEDHPDVYASFINGNHVIRRSNRYWAGISSDLFIEQVLMRSVKTAGGLTRGRGMTESQRSLWLMSMPACAEINQAMQDLSGVGYFSSEQHKDETHARQKKDTNDIQTLLTFLKSRNPFIDSEVDRSLRNIETGVVADKTVNVDDAKKVGTSILQELVGKNIADHTFRRKKQAITLGNKVQAKLDGEPLRIDSQLLFQRCTTAAHGIFEDISEIFQFELCGVPSSIFETTGLPREPQKSTLAEYMWNLIGLKPKAPTETHFVLDGGSLIHRLPWAKGATVDTICMTYFNYVNNHYTDATVVFDGYPSVPTTKDVTHFRRTKGIISPKVNFNNATPIKTKKDEFLSNSENKQHFINTLGEKLKDGHVQVIHAEDDC